MITLYIQCANPESEARRLATYLRDADLPFRLTGDKCVIQNHYEPEFDIYIVTQAPVDLNYTVSRSLTDGTIHFTADWVTQCLAEPAQTKPEDELHIPSEALISYADSSKSHTPFLNPDQTAIVIDIAQRLGRQPHLETMRDIINTYYTRGDSEVRRTLVDMVSQAIDTVDATELHAYMPLLEGLTN